MIGLVAFLSMDLGRASALSRIFALTGLFRLVILVGLTSVDVLARHDHPTPMLTRPRSNGGLIRPSNAGTSRTRNAAASRHAGQTQ